MAAAAAMAAAVAAASRADTVQFGQVMIRMSEVFYRSQLSMAFVNLRPIRPGHVLVAPQRVVKRMADLTPQEVSDLFLTAQHVGTLVERAFSGTSLLFAVQDGPEAGQTVSHVHVHVIPRQKGDFANNDDIYQELDRTKRMGVEDDRPDRSLDMMAAEADMLRRQLADV